ncbi:ABC transporter ATP-binding protein [Paenibacillus pinihumi]|uniref:ABC transporter ATP-binding protein n=1 Tax=Paenibacillus pinihumi TaxID=669462 RepID=UPI000420B98F|nr:ABC transporter ATP-binding protein [Paenibacillus pinihumi]
MGEIRIRRLEKAFGTVKALKPVDLTIRSGSFTTLLGPSGCGKTTLLRMLAGLEEPDQGEIYVNGECFFSKDKRTNRPVHKRHFGMVFQDFALWPHMTVFENVAFGLRAAKRKTGLREEVMHALKTVRLEGMEKRYPHQLSGGQQQRVAFARAIAIRPGLILFDEPLSALDAVLRDELRAELIHLVKQMGMTALYVTHDQTEAMSMSDEVVVMKEGEILQMGTPEQIYGTPAHSFVARFIGKSNWLEPDKRMLRPEHVRWSENSASDQQFTAIVKHASYMGDRYELELDIHQGSGSWIAYSPTRLAAGEYVQVYVSKEHIHEIQA